MSKGDSLIEAALISVLTVLVGCEGPMAQGRWVELAVAEPHGPAIGPLRRSTVNPRYFATPDGTPILLTGAHTWTNVQDGGVTDPPAPFSFERFLDAVAVHGQNFVRLWSWEQAAGSADWGGDFWFQPSPFQRTGPGLALDGKPRFDLTQFNEAYFQRLRQRIQLARERGIYVSVMLFNGWSIEDKDLGLQNPWRGHPFNVRNNINGIDGDANGDGEGHEVHSLLSSYVLELQEAYVRHVLEAVNEFDNVLFEISNESPGGSQEWQYHMLRFVREYERRLGSSHPVGMTVEWPNGDNAVLMESSADWISPNGVIANPAATTGEKVILDDTDHLCGICGDMVWVWKSALRGRNPIFMDLYDGLFPLDPPFDHRLEKWELIRDNLGYARTYTLRMGLAGVMPSGDLASSGYCLARRGPSEPAFLALSDEDGGLELDLSASKGAFYAEWLNLETGQVWPVGEVTGGRRLDLRKPFRGPGVAYLEGRQGSVPASSGADTHREPGNRDRA